MINQLTFCGAYAFLAFVGVPLGIGITVYAFLTKHENGPGPATNEDPTRNDRSTS